MSWLRVFDSVEQNSWNYFEWVCKADEGNHTKSAEFLRDQDLC